MRLLHCLLWLFFSSVALLGFLTPADAYIGGPPASLGMMCHWSTHAVVAQVEKVDRAKGIVIFRKIRDIKGKWPAEQIKQIIGTTPDRQYILQWAEVGKITTVFALESYKWSHTYIDKQWYASVTNDWQWWNMSHVEPILLRTYSGKTDRLIAATSDIYAGKEVVVPCMEGDNMQALASGKAKIQRLRSSLKLLDYNAKRDFVNWGSDDYRALTGMPGFSHALTLSRIDPETQAIASIDFDANGSTDMCLLGTGKGLLLQNGGDYFQESYLSGLNGGGRAAAWADYNGDSLPDLLLSALGGPKLYTNLGNGLFKDDSALLPIEPHYQPGPVAWIDQDADGLPDVLLTNGYHGLRLYRNRGMEPATAKRNPKDAPPLWFEDRSDVVGLGDNGAGIGVKAQSLLVADFNNDGFADILLGAETPSMLVVTPKGYEPLKDSGLAFATAKACPVLADFDHDGDLDLFVPEKGACKLYKNNGHGRYHDVTEQAGDLARFDGWATSAAWGDCDNDGRLDLVIGCLMGPNRFFRGLIDGTFEDATEKIGLHQRRFNTQAVGLADFNHDGVLDMLFANEGQDSVILLGNPAIQNKHVPVTLAIAGSGGVVGSRVKILNSQDKLIALEDVTSGGKGGMPSAQVRFALAPGSYQGVVRYTSGTTRSRNFTVTGPPVRTRIDEKTPELAQGKPS